MNDSLFNGSLVWNFTDPNHCVLNQQAMLKGLNTMPSVVFWVGTLGVVFLLVHFLLLPRFRDHKWYEYIGNSIGMFGTSLCFLSMWICLLVTFDVSTWDLKTITTVGFCVLIPLASWLVYKWLRGLKK
jgi:hypothetical protein